MHEDFGSLPEERLIRILRGNRKKSPRQLNDLFTADAELVDLGDGNVLACTTDTLNEEIKLGIIRDPWKIGWTAVNINFSDLAAVGADPLGLLLAWTIPETASQEYLGIVSQGVSDALAHHHTYLLGGDVNSGNELQLCGTALGLVPKGAGLLRTGVKPGQRIFVTGTIGLGNALGVARLMGLDAADMLEKLYRPAARLDAVRLVREFAAACIDTSDGVLASLDTLSRLSHCGIDFLHRPMLYNDELKKLAGTLKIPLWLFAVAEHGEFELVFAVDEGRCGECLRKSREMQIEILEIGRAVESNGIRMEVGKAQVPVDVKYVRGLTSHLRTNPGEYIRSLIAYSHSIGMRE